MHERPSPQGEGEDAIPTAYSKKKYNMARSISLAKSIGEIRCPKGKRSRSSSNDRRERSRSTHDNRLERSDGQSKFDSKSDRDYEKSLQQKEHKMEDLSRMKRREQESKNLKKCLWVVEKTVVAWLGDEQRGQFYSKGAKHKQKCGALDPRLEHFLSTWGQVVWA